MSKELETAKDFQVKRYLGKWYEIARLPNWYEANSSFGEGGPIAEYKLADGIIEIKNSSVKKDTNKESFVEGAAYPVTKGDNTKLYVSFPRFISSLLYYPVRFSPFKIKGNYWILRVIDSVDTPANTPVDTPVNTPVNTTVNTPVNTPANTLKSNSESVSDCNKEGNYKIAYVGSPDRSTLWLLARMQTVSVEEYESFLEYADGNGFDKSKILRVRN